MFAQSSEPERLMLETLDKLKIQNKIKCELCMNKYDVLKKLTLELKTMRSCQVLFHV